MSLHIKFMDIIGNRSTNYTLMLLQYIRKRHRLERMSYLYFILIIPGLVFQISWNCWCFENVFHKRHPQMHFWLEQWFWTWEHSFRFLFGPLSSSNCTVALSQHYTFAVHDETYLCFTGSGKCTLECMGVEKGGIFHMLNVLHQFSFLYLPPHP